MRIIAKTPGENGAYPPIQDWGELVPPEGYYKLSDGLDVDLFQQYNGFVTLTTARNIVMDYEPNMEAWEAWKASLPPDPGPQPEPEYVTYDELAAAIREGVNEV